MRHTIEELGELAEENADGGFSIWQTPHARRGLSGKKWGAQIGEAGSKHYGATPAEAVDLALDAHERAKNPDNNGFYCATVSDTGGEFLKMMGPWSAQVDGAGPKYYGATPGEAILKALESLGQNARAIDMKIGSNPDCPTKVSFTVHRPGKD